MTAVLRMTAAAMCICTSLFAFHPAAAATPGQVSSGTLAGGAAYIMRPDGLARTAAMELWFRAPSSGDDAKYPGISRLAITALAASSAAHATSLSELVNRYGGRLAINVYPDIVSVAVSVPSWDAPQTLRALSSAYFSPTVSAGGMKAALRDCAVAAAQAHFDAERMLQDALFAQLFTAGPAHYAPTPSTAADFSRIPQEAVTAFAQRYFRQANAVISLAGAVDSSLLSNVRSSSAAGSMDAPYDSTVAASPAPASKSAFVSGIGYAWAGPAISDARAATALDFLADYVFDSAHGTLARAIQQKDPKAYVNGQFITLHNPGVLLLTVSGTASPDIRAQITDALAAMQQPMDAKTFAAARNAFEYHLFNQMQTPLSRADNFGWYAAEGNAAYAPGSQSGDYLQAVQSLDPAFVAQTARTYLQHPAIVQLISSDRKGTST